MLKKPLQKSEIRFEQINIIAEVGTDLLALIRMKEEKIEKTTVKQRNRSFLNTCGILNKIEPKTDDIEQFLAKHK